MYRKCSGVESVESKCNYLHELPSVTYPFVCMPLCLYDSIVKVAESILSCHISTSLHEV